MSMSGPYRTASPSVGDVRWELCPRCSVCNARIPVSEAFEGISEEWRDMLLKEAFPLLHMMAPTRRADRVTGEVFALCSPDCEAVQRWDAEEDVSVMLHAIIRHMRIPHPEGLVDEREWDDTLIEDVFAARRRMYEKAGVR